MVLFETKADLRLSRSFLLSPLPFALLGGRIGHSSHHITSHHISSYRVVTPPSLLPLLISLLFVTLRYHFPASSFTLPSSSPSGTTTMKHDLNQAALPGRKAERGKSMRSGDELPPQVTLASVFPYNEARIR